ncbi:MAG: hypothetical protein WD024_08640 [Bacillota bacterium]
MSEDRFDSRDTAIKQALSTLVDEMPTAGKSEGWERIERTLYPRTKGSSSASRWRIALASVALVAALIFGLSRIPEVNAWGWRLLFASRDLREIAWEPGAGLDSILGTPLRVLVVDPSSSEWALQAISLDLRDDVGTVVALRYKDVTGAVFTLRETPAAGNSETPNFDAQDPSQFLLKVGRSNVAFFLPGPGLVSASWVTDGLQVEVWGSGGIQTLVKFIESLVPYPPQSQPGKSSTT